MARTADPDINGVASLVNGLPTITFSPKMYTRYIRNIVVLNSVPGAVNVYRGQLVSTPIASNRIGDNNTLQGDIKIPAGQPFFVQWAAAGSPVSSATARVSLEGDDSPLGDAGSGGTTWTSNEVTSITLPNTAVAGQARIFIGTPLPPPLDTYLFFNTTKATGGIVFYAGTPTDDDYTFLVLVNTGPNVYIYIGHVLNGVVIEGGTAGSPVGMNWVFTGSGTANINMVLGSTDDFVIDTRPQGRGDAGKVILTASSGFTAGVPLLVISGPLIRFRQGRCYKLEYECDTDCSAANGFANYEIRRTSTGQVLRGSGGHVMASVAGFGVTCKGSGLVINVTGADIIDSIDLYLSAFIAGNVRLDAASSRLAYLMATDIGAAGFFNGATQIV